MLSSENKTDLKSSYTFKNDTKFKKGENWNFCTFQQKLLMGRVMLCPVLFLSLSLPQTKSVFAVKTIL